AELCQKRRRERARDKAYFRALLALIAVFWGIASLGESGSWSHALNAVVVTLLAAWVGWLMRDCDEA
ncbi:MAG TPA: hypothetical protein VF389_00920, partial [Woeseiaceae bacterium]